MQRFQSGLQFASHLEFEAAVQKHRGERHARGFHCGDQFVAMIFCPLGHTLNLREITAASEIQLALAFQR